MIVEQLKMEGFYCFFVAVGVSTASEVFEAVALVAVISISLYADCFDCAHFEEVLVTFSSMFFLYLFLPFAAELVGGYCAFNFATLPITND